MSRVPLYGVMIALMLVLPVIASVLEALFYSHGPLSLGVLLRWFVFFPVGVRLSLVGLRQVLQPQPAADEVLPVGSAEAQRVVRERGFARCGIGVIGLVSLFWGEYLYPAGLAGAVFYGLTGLSHLLHKGRTRHQSVAMVCDLLVAILLGVLLLPS